MWLQRPRVRPALHLLLFGLSPVTCQPRSWRLALGVGERDRGELLCSTYRPACGEAWRAAVPVVVF